MSDDDFPDDDYEPSQTSLSSGTDSNEDSITISESNLSVHEEDGFLALKETSSKEVELDPNTDAYKMEAESQC